MICLALLGVGAAAASPPSHWVRAPAPPAPLRAVAADGPDLVALTRTGAVVRLTEGRWWADGPATPTSSSATGLVVQGDTIWVYTPTPPKVQPLAGGAWGPREPVPVAELTALVALGEHLVASGLHGTAATRRAGAWAPLDISSGHLLARPDGRGGLWWWSSATATEPVTEVLHTDGAGQIDERGPTVDHWAGREATLTVGADGRPVWGADAVFRLSADGVRERLSAEPATAIAQGHQLWATSAHGATADGVRAPLPVPMTALGARPSGEVWGLSASGDLYFTEPGAGIALRDVSDRWSSAALLGRRALVADLDGDGRDDVVTLDTECRSRAWLQREASFEDVTESWGLPRCASLGATGDLDGDLRPDLVLLVPTRSTSDRELRVLRNLGRFEDATERAFATAPPTALGSGIAQLEDMDRDGDLDVVVTAGGHPDVSDRVFLWLNDGHGRLTRAPLPTRGLAYEAFVGVVLHTDLDRDAIADLLLVSYWGDGHSVLRGLEGGGWRDESPIAGLRGVFGVPLQATLVDVDGDGLDDLLTTGRERPQLWRNTGDLRFEGATDALGLAGAPAMRGSAVVDLDRDGAPDLVGCGAECGLWQGADGAWAERSRLLPHAELGADWVTALDLGGDGDSDLLLLGVSGSLLLENQAELNATPAAPVPVRPRFGRVRRLLWLDPVVDLGAGSMAALALLLAAVRVRSSGARLLLGRGWGLPAALGALASGLVLAADRPPAARGALGGAVVLLAGGLAVAEPRWHRLRAAQRVAGYRLLGTLGRGGMGTVYLARDERTGREVALKLVNPDLLERDEDFDLYREEARIGASIEHPSVVPILGWGEWTALDGERLRRTAYLVMERVEGITVRAWAAAQGEVAVGEACAVVADVCRALDAIHTVDVVHRDVKPSNVMIASDGRVVLMDFGAARYVGQVTRGSRGVLGTLGYLAPEQGRGHPADPRSDVYACGVMLYELLAGRRPFVADNLVTLMARVLEEEPAPLARDDLPDGLEALLYRALAKHPEGRPFAAQMAAELDAWASARPSATRGADDGPATATPIRRPLA